MNINLKSKKPANMLQPKKQKTFKEGILQPCFYGCRPCDRRLSESSDR